MTKAYGGGREEMRVHRQSFIYIGNAPTKSHEPWPSVVPSPQQGLCWGAGSSGRGWGYCPGQRTVKEKHPFCIRPSPQGSPRAPLSTALPLLQMSPTLTPEAICHHLSSPGSSQPRELSSGTAEVALEHQRHSRGSHITEILPFQL